MHSLFFGAKRIFHSTLRLTRKQLANRGLTAARFDMLTAIGQRFRFFQRELPGWLGVSRATVSRMLISLAKLGLVERKRAPGDRRQWLLNLTDAGRAAVDEATRFFIGSGAVRKALECALCDGWVLGTPRDYEIEMNNAEFVFERLRDGFGDRAQLVY